MKVDVVIVGGGVIGTAIARELSRFSINTTLIEKEDDVLAERKEFRNENELF